MSNITLHTIIALLLIPLLGTFGYAADCVDDGNNDASTAITLSFIDTHSNVVCPTDPFDYYKLEIPAGARLRGGSFSLNSAEPGTVLRLTGGSGTIWEEATSTSVDSIGTTFDSDELTSGIYYFRVTHYSRYAYDHNYTFEIDISVDPGSGCIADGNNDVESAEVINFGDTVDDWVCDADHVDIYRFEVTDATTEGEGRIVLTSSPNELFLSLYNSSGTEILTRRTYGGHLEYSLDSSGSALPMGGYYIGVFLPETRDDENSYSLNLQAGELEIAPVYRIEAPVSYITSAPWPTPDGKPDGAGRSIYNGPNESMIDYQTIDLYDEFGIDSSVRDDKFSNLVVGQDGWVYFTYLENSSSWDRIRTIHAYNIKNQAKWNAPAGSLRIALDGSSNIYYIDSLGNNLVSRSPGGAYRWTVNIPGNGYREIETISNRVFVSTYRRDGRYISSFSLDGVHLWSSGPFGRTIFGFAADYTGNSYIIYTGGMVSKINSTGGIVWNYEIDLGDFNVSSLFLAQFHGPVICRDGRIYVTTPFRFSEPLSSPGWRTELTVLGSSGNLIAESMYGNENQVYGTVYGGNDKLYVTTSNGYVTAYSDFINEAWSQGGLQSGIARDIAMGADNQLYILSAVRGYGSEEDALKIFSINGLNGNVTKILKLALPGDQALNESEIAIGPDKNLILLHSSGYLKVIRELYIPPVSLPLDLLFEPPVRGDGDS